MKIINERTLDKFRSHRTCEYCLKPCTPDPHHLWAKGMGGGGRIDLAINLISLCRECHTKLHDGNIEHDELLSIVARREQTSIEAIAEVMYMIRRMSRNASPHKLSKEIDGMVHESRVLACEVLAEYLE